MESLTNHYWANQRGRQPPLRGGLGARPRAASSARHWSKHRIRRNRWRHPAAPKTREKVFIHIGIQNILGPVVILVSRFHPSKCVEFEGIWNFLWRWVSNSIDRICGNWQFVQRTRIKYITLQNSPKLGMIMGSGKVLHLCSGKASESVSSTLATCFLLGFCTAKKKPLGMILGICRSRQPGYPWNKETFLPLLNHLLVWCSVMQSKSHPINIWCINHWIIVLHHITKSHCMKYWSIDRDSHVGLSCPYTQE